MNQPTPTMQADMKRAYRDMLEDLRKQGPISSAPEDVEAFANVKAYLTAQLDRLESQP